MATLFKPTRSQVLPANADIIRKSGKQFVRVKERGKWMEYPLSKDGKHYLKPTAKGAAEVRFPDGRRKRVRLSPNRDAAAVMLADLLKKIENEKAGIRDEYANHRKLTLTQLLKHYEQHQSDRGNTPKQAKQVYRRCEIVFAACKFYQLTDLTVTPVERWLATRRQLPKSEGGISPQTSNHYTVALKAFGYWLVKAHYLENNPFRHLGRVNVQIDIRHVRRPLTQHEFLRLIVSTRSGRTLRGHSGADRAMLYLVAGMTGLRASELASLKCDSFHLESDPATVVVEAAYSKHRRRDEVPLHPELVNELRAWLVGKPENQPLWPGKWAKNNEASDLIKHDLNAARVAWIGESTTEEEKQEREASDFLKYRDTAGHVADFHSLRHRFVTELVKAGVQPKDAKELARHSTITLTMDRYAHVGVQDTANAVAKLTMPTPRPPSEGKTGAVAVAFRGTTEALVSSKGAAPGAAEIGDCRESAEIGEKIAVVSQKGKRARLPRKSSVREGLRTEEEIHPSGFEPLTFGSVDRCSIQLSYGCSEDIVFGFGASVNGSLRCGARIRDLL